MSAPLKVGDVVTLKTGLSNGVSAERFVVIHGAARPAMRWDSYARQTAAGNYIVPAGWHVQSLDNGRLATYPSADLTRVGNLVAEIEGLLPRARKVVGA